MTELRPCPACETDAATRLDAYSQDQWHVARCNGCGLVYLRNPVPYDALEEDFAWEKTYEAKKDASRGSTSLSPVIRSLRHRLGLTHRGQKRQMGRWFNNGKVLDIGCGNLDNVPEPMTPFGIELSRSLHAIADERMRARGGQCVHGAGAEAIWQFEPDMFDGVVMHSYLEHEIDLMGVLKGVWRALKPGGAAFVRVPNFGSINRRVVGSNWCGFRYPDHVTYFTESSLRDVARRAGFTLQVVNRIGLPIDDNIKALLRKGTVPA
ncbi:MAG: class I SAM-dependent methyltransferase [Pseudomonadota bacterium]